MEKEYMSVGVFSHICNYDKCRRQAQFVIYKGNVVFATTCEVHSIHFQKTVNELLEEASAS